LCPHARARAHHSIDDIAVHTWSHRHTSTLNNEQILAELGWCIQIIHDSTGGRIPAFWRPPYGDADNRVRAIAKLIFGLTTVIWNYDSDDWNIGASGITLQSVEDGMVKALSGPKSPGLLMLEHEISADDVTNFIDSYPLMVSNNWPVKSVPELTGADWYFNAKDNSAPVASMDNFLQYPPRPKPTTSSDSSVQNATNVSTATAVATAKSQQGGSASFTSAPRRLITLTVLLSALGAYYL
jgi:chitin deacetylase